MRKEFMNLIMARRSGSTRRTGRQKRVILSRRTSSVRRLTLDLPEPLHRAIKISAARDGVAMAQKLRALLMKHYRLSDDM
jgi:hypothetical protein